jgi:hypothetical protein
VRFAQVNPPADVSVAIPDPLKTRLVPFIVVSDPVFIVVVAPLWIMVAVLAVIVKFVEVEVDHDCPVLISVIVEEPKVSVRVLVFTELKAPHGYG